MTDICRLCLSKNFVNHSIFGDDSGLFYKIDACLPLKISESDNLPKKICDKCTLKINDIHEYCTNAVNAEKHLMLTVFQITNTNTFINNEEKALLISPFNARAQKKPNEPRNDTSNWSVKKHTSPISPEYSISIVDHGIKEEPSDSYEVLNSENNKDPALNRISSEEVSSSHSYSTKCTQTELCLSDVIKDSILTQNKELFIDTDKVIKEEVFFNESPVENDFNFESVDNNQYSSDDDVTLNKIIKVVPPIKVKLNKTHPDSSKVKHKKSKKRKKELKEPEVIAKRSRGRPKGSLNKKIDGKDKEKPKSKKRSRKSIYDECGIKLDIKVEGINVLEKVGGVKDDGDKWFYPKGTAEDEKKWQCLTCFAFKSSRTDLLQHYKDHVENPTKFQLDNNIGIKCEDAIIVKDEPEDGKDDIGVEANSRDYIIVKAPQFGNAPAFQCLKCCKIFINKKSVMRHLVCHDDSRPFPCNICGRTYKRAYEILLHGRAHSGVKTLFCRYEQCNYSTVYRGALLSHHKRHEPNFKYTCDICNKGFDVLTWFTEHKNLHTGEKPFVCDICSKSFIYSRYLASHRKSVHPETSTRKLLHRCPDCPMEFPHRKQLRTHAGRVHNAPHGGRVLCDICGKGLSSREHLKFHRRIHTGEKPHVCRICHKGFVKKCNLTLHERVHSGERPHVCSHCGKAFSQRSTLVIHERYHSGARPYTCQICNKGFVAKGLLSMHQKTCLATSV